MNPLRGRNNVQGSCDMGSFPHELPGYQHVADPIARGRFESVWGVKLDDEPGLRIPNMFDAAIEGTFKALYVQGEDIAQSDPNTQHVEAALTSLDCLIVQDIFLNETAKFAHVLLPGSSFLEKNGTFTNAERRINRVRKVMPALAGKEDWQVTQDLANALGYPMHYTHPSEIMDEIAQLTPSFAGVSYAKLEEHGSTPSGPATPSTRWACRPCTRLSSPSGWNALRLPSTWPPRSGPTAASRYCSPPAGSLASTTWAPRPGAPTTSAGTMRTCWSDPSWDAELRGIRDGDWLGITSRAGQTVLRARLSERMQPGVVYTTFHHPGSGANVITTDNSDWATNCPEYKVTAVQVEKVSQPSAWQQRFSAFDLAQRDYLAKAQTQEVP